MTAMPSRAGGTPGWEIPDDDVGDEDVDVLSLAGQQPPAGGAWLWVTTAEARRGGEFTALFLPRNRPLASGGDVLLHVRPHPAEEVDGPGMPAARVQVWAVAAGSLVRIAGWDPAGPDVWPEIVRETVAFAMGALTELEQHGADVCAREEVDVIAAAESVPTGFPALPVRVSAAG